MPFHHFIKIFCLFFPFLLFAQSESDDLLTIHEIPKDSLFGIWQSTDKYQIEENTFAFTNKGWYKFTEQEIALKEDSLGAIVELGLYYLDGNIIYTFPLTGKYKYQSHHYTLDNFKTGTFQLSDYEKGNSGEYLRQPDSTFTFTETEIDFFKGIEKHNELLLTAWTSEDTGESWHFYPPNFVLFKKDGGYNGMDIFHLQADTLSFVNAQTGQVFQKGSLEYFTDDSFMYVESKKEGKIAFQTSPFVGLTAKEMVFYKRYLETIHRLSPEEAYAIKKRVEEYWVRWE